MVCVAYSPVVRNGFIWDDDKYVTDNTALEDLGGLVRIWAEPGATPQYYPLVFTTFWLEKRAWGLEPLGYHLVNVGLHLAAALLFWALLLRLGVAGAFLGACLFALHPVHVESVAWVTERKNVLSGVLYLGSMLAYLRFAPPSEGGDDPPPKGIGAYILALLLFAGALLAKSVTASLPAALLVIIWWRRGHVRGRDLLPLLPFFFLGALAGLHTAYLERQHVGAEGMWWDYGPVERILIAGRAVWFYLGKLFVPHPLIFIYPRWRIDASVWWQYLFPLALLLLGAVLWIRRDRLGRGPLAALLFFVGTLLPALGLLNVYPMRYSFVADHFQYLASLGPIALAAAAAVLFAGRLFPRGGWVPRLLALPPLVLFGLLTWRQAGIYRNVETLWIETLAKDPGSPLAHNNLGVLLEERGKTAEAIAHYEKALRREPLLAEAHYNLGVAHLHGGDLDAAESSLEEALRLWPSYADALVNLGALFERRGDAAAARRRYDEALRHEPDNATAHYNLGVLFIEAGERKRAREHFNLALEARPDYADAHYNLGVVRLKEGDPLGAAEHFRRALEIEPRMADAHYNLGLIALQLGDYGRAEEHFLLALRARRGYRAAQTQLIRVRALKRGTEGP